MMPVACHLSCHMLCFPCLSCLSALCLFHMLYASFTCFLHLSSFIACLLVSCLCLCMYTHGARAHGVRAQSPRRKQKGRGCEHVDISQATMFNSCKSLASPIWLCTLLNPLPPSFLSQMGCIRYIMPCTIRPHLQSMATPVYFPAPIFQAMLQGCRHLLSCSVCQHCA